MPTLNDGKFSFEIPTAELSRGLRTTKRNPRNSKFLTECNGVVGLDNVLQVLEGLEEIRVVTDEIVGEFPYPQLFVFKKLIVICSATTIYELVGGSLVSKLTVTAAILWSAAEFNDFIYMSNGRVAVKRSPESGVWSATEDYPAAAAICDYNGQVVIGAPNRSAV